MTPILEDLKAKLSYVMENHLQGHLREVEHRECAVEERERQLEARERQLEAREEACREREGRVQQAAAKRLPTPSRASAAAEAGCTGEGPTKRQSRPPASPQEEPAVARPAGSSNAAPHRLWQQGNVPVAGGGLFNPQEVAVAPSASGGGLFYCLAGSEEAAAPAPPEARGGLFRSTSSGEAPLAEGRANVAPRGHGEPSPRDSPLDQQPCIQGSSSASQIKDLFEQKASAAKRGSLSPSGRRRTWTPKEHQLPLPDGSGRASFRAHDAPFQPRTSFGAPPPEKRSLADLLKKDEERGHT